MSVANLTELEKNIIKELSEKFEIKEFDVEAFGNLFKSLSEEFGVETLDEKELKKILMTLKAKEGELTEEEKEWEISALPVPESIKEELLRRLRGIKLDRQLFAKILNAVVEKYETAKVEPCEAVGIVAAQSIGEPGTQMSLPYGERIIVKEGEEIKPVEIGALVDRCISKYGCLKFGGGDAEVCELPLDVNILVPSLDANGKIRWKRVLACIRHKAPQRLLKVRTASGREIIATDYHSFVIKEENKIVPVRGSELRLGDRIPVVKFLPVSSIETLNFEGRKVKLDYDLGRALGAYFSSGNATAAAPKLDWESKMLQRLTGRNRLPNFVYNANEEFVRGLLHEYFDVSGEVELRLRSKELADGFALLLTRFGIFSTKRREGSQYVLRIPEAADGGNNDDGDAEDVVWDEIVELCEVKCGDEHVYDVSVEGFETFMTFEGIITHNTMRTFHYAGVGAIYVTLGLPRIIEIVDARKNPSTPVMTVYLEDKYAHDKNKAEGLAMEIEETRVSHIAEVRADVDRMLVVVRLKEEMLEKKRITVEDAIAKIEEGLSKKGFELEFIEEEKCILVHLGEKSYRKLLRLEEEIANILVKGIEGIKRVIIRMDEKSREYVLYTEGSALKKVMQIEGIDYRRTTTNNVHEIAEVLGIEAARNAIIEEMINTLEEQGLNVDVRHIMLVADMMTVDGEIKQIGRHGVAGEKASVLSRAAFEVTVNHLLDAAMYGYVDELRGVTENVIVGQPIRLGTGDVELVAKRFDQLMKELKKAKA